MHYSISPGDENDDIIVQTNVDLHRIPRKKRGGTRIASDGDGVGARGAPFAGQQHGGPLWRGS